MLHQRAFILFALLIPGVVPRNQLSSSKDYVSFQNFRSILTSATAKRDDTDILPSLVADLFEALMSSSFPTAVAEGISEQCKTDSIEYVENIIQNRSIWALQMKESSGKLPIGFFGLGNYRADGLFDECLAIRAPKFDGEYCTIFLKPAAVDPSQVVTPPPDTLTRQNMISILQILGELSGPGRVTPRVEEALASVAFLPSISFCLPSSCSAQDLGEAVAQLIGSYVIANHSVVTIADEDFCFKQKDEPKSFDAADIAVSFTLSTIGFLAVVATLYESYRNYMGHPIKPNSETLPVRTLYCFSISNNSRKLLSMKTPNSADSFGCIHGLRFFSMTWVVLGHVFYFGPTRLALNQDHLYRDAVHWTFQTISNGTVSVDTFFVMSGLLASYLILRELDRTKGRINIGLLYLHRYLRLTIVYAIVLGFVATLIVYLGTGPNWFFVPVVSKFCRQHWWQSLLYLNNLYPGNSGVGVCMGHTWYLSVDMQLFLVSPFVIYPLWRWKRVGLMVLAAATLAGLASDFIVYGLYNLPPTSMVSRTDLSDVLDEFNDKYYVKPWTRSPPYFIGIWFGWILYATRNSYVRMSKGLVAGLWALATGAALAIVYGIAPYADQIKTPTIPAAVSMTYGPLHRTAWGIVIGWIIFACSRGHGGIVNRILSWRGFVPLARLTYCVYLIHIDFLNVYFARQRRLYYYTFFGQITTYVGLLMSIMGLACVITVLVEASFLNLEKLIFAPSKKDVRILHEAKSDTTTADESARSSNTTITLNSDTSHEKH